MPSWLHRHAALAAPCGLFTLLALFFFGSGALWPRNLPPGADSPLAITGMALMLILMPTYFVAAALRIQPHSLRLLEQLRPLLPEPAEADAAAAEVRAGLARSWPAGALLGVVLGLANANLGAFVSDSPTRGIDASFSAGQLLLWMLGGLFLGTRVVAARAFSRLGDHLRFDPFRLEALRPLARAGLADLLVIAGALALSPLQALDAQFRWYNYHYALLVSVPASAFLLLWPQRRIKKRIRAELVRRLEEVDRLIAAPREATGASLAQLETWLAHRDRLRGTSSWLLGSALLSRVFLYIVIPPLAWLGAAIVEWLVERWLGG